MARRGGSALDPSLGFASSFNPGDGSRPRYNTLGALVHVPPRPLSNERTLGIICTGQSTMSNWGGGTLYTAVQSRSHQLNILNRRVYPAADPMFGCDGTGVSPGSAIGDYLIADDKWDRVTVANVAFGSTISSQWASSTNNLAQGLKIAWTLLIAHGYENIVQLHQQGEGDAAAGTSRVAMLANLRALDTWRRAYGISCPMYVSRTTFGYDWTTSAPDSDDWTPGSVATGIRAAQLEAVNSDTILQGPDTDEIRGQGSRGASTHWTVQAGAHLCAEAWADVLPTG